MWQCFAFGASKFVFLATGKFAAKCMRNACVLCYLRNSVLLNVLKTNFSKNGNVKAEKFMRYAYLSCCLHRSVSLNALKYLYSSQIVICDEMYT